MMIWMDVDTAVEVPVNVLPLTDDTDFKSVEEGIAYNESGMDLNWNFVTSAGVVTQTNVTPTTMSFHDWTHYGNGMYKIGVPTIDGDINNISEGYGWFVGICDGVLSWCGPRIGFRAAAINDALCDGGDVLDVNLTHILAHLLTQGAANRLADGFEHFFNVASPAIDIGDAMVGTNGAALASAYTAARAAFLDNIDGHTAQTGDSFARIGATGSGLTSVAQASLVTAARMGALTDWINGERLDLLLDKILADTGTDGVVLASSEDIYWADIHFARDSANSQDEYEVVWVKNGAPVTTGITVPKIQVVNRADGTDLVAATAMTQIGSTGAYKYDEDTDRVTLGEAVLVIVTATIDAATRTWSRIVGRDTSE